MRGFRADGNAQRSLSVHGQCNNLFRLAPHHLKAENRQLLRGIFEADTLDYLLGRSVAHRIAVGPHQRREVLTVQTLSDCNEPFVDPAGIVAA